MQYSVLSFNAAQVAPPGAWLFSCRRVFALSACCVSAGEKGWIESAGKQHWCQASGGRQSVFNFLKLKFVLGKRCPGVHTYIPRLAWTFTSSCKRLHSAPCSVFCSRGLITRMRQPGAGGALTLLPRVSSHDRHPR